MRTGSAALYAAFVVNGIATTLLGPLLPGLQARWHIGDARAGLLFTAQFLASVAASPWVAPLARRFRGGYVPLVAAGMLLIAVGTAGLNFAPWPWLAVVVMVYGCGTGFAIPAGNLAMAALHPGASARGVMMINLAWCAGAVLAPLAALRAPFWAVPAACVLCAALLRRSETAAVTPLPRERLRRVLPAVITALLLFLYVGTENSLAGWVASLGARTASTRSWWSVLPALFWAGIVAGRAIAPALFARLHPPALVHAGLALAFAGVALLLLPAGALLTISAVVLCGLGLAPIFPLVVSQYADAEGARGASGLIFSAGGLGGAAIPWMVGALSQAAGSLREAMAVALACILLMAALQAVLKNMLRPGGEPI